MKKEKQQVFTFKADSELAEMLRQVPNRSEFIRNALGAAFEQCCPLCKGAGSLTPDQQKHWAHFLACHSLKRCDECDAVHFVCNETSHGGIQ